MTATSAEARDSEGEGVLASATYARRRSSGRTLVLVGAVLAVALMLAVPVRSWLSQRAELDRLHAEMAQTQDRVDALAEQKQRWEDPRFVAAQARVRLNMVKPGQFALIALERQDARQEEIQQPPTTTWYEKLWDTTRSVAAPDQLTEPPR